MPLPFFVHEYDTALKSVIRRLGGGVLAAITGFAIERWHNVELPEIRNLRADLIGEAVTGELVHIELQSTNDPEMAVRMAEYALAVYRRFDRLPEQIVLYVGEAPLRMPGTLTGAALSYRCRLLDIRELDGEPLLESAHLEDNVIAVLMRLRNQREAVRRVLGRIAESGPERRETALRELTILTGLRSLGETVRQELKTMPILDDIAGHDWLGPEFRRERREGERTLVTLQTEKRFGPLPAWAGSRLATMTAPELEDFGLRLLDARNLEELFASRTS